MQGVTILETINTPCAPLWMVIVAAVCCLILVSLIVPDTIRLARRVYHLGTYQRLVIIGQIICDIIIIACVIAGGFGLYGQHNTIETTYRVTIDESVSFVEFDNKYEVVSRDANEYVIKERLVD